MSTITTSEAAYLAELGARVRTWRERAGLTRKALAARSGLSERYLAQLEAGQGNLSILLLRQLAQTMSLPLAELAQEAAIDAPAELQPTQQFLAQLSAPQLRAALRLLQSEFGHGMAGSRSERIALIGLRGAGKSTLGAALAKNLNAPFIELDREVERVAGAKLGEIFSLYGQDGFRRFERLALQSVLREHTRAVIATGGSFVTDAEGYELLRASCFTVWLKARPEEHMARVVAQGDLRPIQGHARAMDELRSILAERERLYALADATLDTSGKKEKQSVTQLQALVRETVSESAAARTHRPRRAAAPGRTVLTGRV